MLKNIENKNCIKMIFKFHEKNIKINQKSQERVLYLKTNFILKKAH